MMKLLSDIDIARSVAVASFFELEAAARFCMYISTASVKKILSCAICMFICIHRYSDLGIFSKISYLSA